MLPPLKVCGVHSVSHLVSVGSSGIMIIHKRLKDFLTHTLYTFQCQHNCLKSTAPFSCQVCGIMK